MNFSQNKLSSNFGVRKYKFDLIFFRKDSADQMVQWLGKPVAVPEVPGSNPG